MLQLKKNNQKNKPIFSYKTLATAEDNSPISRYIRDVFNQKARKQYNRNMATEGITALLSYTFSTIRPLYYQINEFTPLPKISLKFTDIFGKNCA